MLPGHPCGNANVSMPPTSQNAPTPESAQHQKNYQTTTTANNNNNGDVHDLFLSSPQGRSNYEILQKMNSMLGNALNLNNFGQENQSIIDGGVNQGTFVDNENNTPNRAVGSMRAIRGNMFNPIRPNDPCEMTSPIKSGPQLSDHLKAILARQSGQSRGGDFGSLIAPLPPPPPPLPVSSSSTSGSTLATASAYHWPPFQVFPNPDAHPPYGMNRIDYCTFREPLTWAPLPRVPSPRPTPPPQSSQQQQTPAPIGRHLSHERSPSTVSSSSSGLSMSHLNDLMAQLNTTDSPPPAASYYQHQQSSQSQQYPILQNGNDGGLNRSEWASIYQLRHGHGLRPQLPPPPTMASLSPPSPPPPPVASSATTPNNNDYAALMMAAANFFNHNNGGVGSNGGHGGSNMSHCETNFVGGSNMDNLENNLPSPDQQYSIEKAARIYRKAATICDATCTWSGQLPVTNLVTRAVHNQSYSCKVFVGGVPWDVTEPSLLGAFGVFGPVRVEWPGKEARYAKSPVKPSAKGKGYVYMIYESDKSVKALLENCVRDYTHAGEYYYQLTSRRLRTKEIRQVQIIPWNIGDSNHVRFPSQRLDPKKTVFVGALHGMITAEVLCNVLNDLFGGVVYAGIDTDKYKYPIGSGRVTFNNSRSYHKAIAAAFVEIKSAKFSKKVQIDPYLEDATCSNCLSTSGPYFCREFMCFRYFCKTCWHNQHALDVMQSHKPLMRNTRRSQQCVTLFPINNGPQF